MNYQRGQRLKPHGYTKCPACAFKPIERHDLRCPDCDANFYPGAQPGELVRLSKSIAPESGVSRNR
jgi:hypothetical protein